MFTRGVNSLNARWWDLKLLYQGIIPPIARDENDFDPSSKYHVIADTPYIKYVCTVDDLLVDPRVIALRVKRQCVRSTNVCIRYVSPSEDTSRARIYFYSPVDRASRVRWP